MRHLQQVRIFLASPGDIRREKKYVEEVVAELNRATAEGRGVVFRVITWDRDAHPAHGQDAQAIINSQIAAMSEISIFVGLMWNRIGTRTPRARSGTIEEFERAVEASEAHQRPSIWFYFRTGPDRYDSVEKLQQRQEVLEFRKEVQQHGLPWDYESPSSFRDIFRQHLLNWLGRVELSPAGGKGIGDRNEDQTAKGSGLAKLANVRESDSVLRFIDLLDPDQLSLELFFAAILAKTREVFAPDLARDVKLPSTPAEWLAFSEAIISMPVNIEWPEPIALARAELEAKLHKLTGRLAPRATSDRESAEQRETFRRLNDAHSASLHLERTLPARLLRMWLALVEYSGPFPKASHFNSQRNYLRFASLIMYRLLAGALADPNGALRDNTPAGVFEGPRWEYQIHRFFDPKDETAVAYVTNIEGIDLRREICIYGPRKITLDAYRQSMARQPIISRWFMEYLVPQVEIDMAWNSPTQVTRYEERAWIRKVVDLSGNDLDYDTPDEIRIPVRLRQTSVSRSKPRRKRKV